MKILEKIISAKRKEVETKKELYPQKLLEQSLYFAGPTVSLSEYLLRDDLLGVIAEIKRRSPSKGAINEFVDVETVSIGYMQAGASALSVLTDKEFFGGSSEDLTVARASNYCPVLRKDFVVDEYQVLEAKSIGADAILLIAAALSTDEMKKLGALAHTFGLEVLTEIHNEAELNTVPFEVVDCIGVNNRDLQSFTVDRGTSLSLFSKLPQDVVKVSESGIEEPAHLVELQRAGFNGFLIGERFMKESRPHDACKRFITEAENLLQ